VRNVPISSNSRELRPSWEATSRSATQEIHSILWNVKFHYCDHWCLSGARSIQSIPLRSILILSSHLRVRLPSDLFPSDDATKILGAFLFGPVRATSWPSHPLWLGEEYKLRSSSLCSFLQSPITSFLFGKNILFSTLLSNTLGLSSSLNVRDQISYPYKNNRQNYVHRFVCSDFYVFR
jgi:hypothetical protein